MQCRWCSQWTFEEKDQEIVNSVVNTKSSATSYLCMYANQVMETKSHAGTDISSSQHLTYKPSKLTS